MSFIELTNIDAGYEKGKPILKDFHVSVEQGELVSLLGPSGCGKTTTLRTTAGFIMAEKGKVVIGGKNYSNVPPNKRNIGLVFQNYALFPHLSVYDNVAYGLRRRKVAKELIPEKIANVLKLVSLTGYEKRLPSELSGGQRQRVALARSIVIEPDLLLLDEPLSNLDAKLRDEMRAELSRLQHQLGITMIYVTHDQVEALSLSSRIIVMNEGNIEQMGTPEDIYERPATPFVANFVGFDNSLTGTVRAVQEHRVTVEVNGSSFVSTRVTQVAGGLSPGDPVAIFFRPDDTRLTDEAGENTIAGEILYVNYQGNTSSYALKVDQKSIRAVMPGRPMPGDNSEIRMRIDPEKLIIERV
jgi:putative spermidine/putrescine transport system ATP-binding protein